MADIELNLFTVPVRWRDSSTSVARAEGNNVAWHCRCGDKLPLQVSAQLFLITFLISLSVLFG
ncbi:hypothetical protein ES706_04638 [subsurface metagenome]